MTCCGCWPDWYCLEMSRCLSICTWASVRRHWTCNWMGIKRLCSSVNVRMTLMTTAFGQSLLNMLVTLSGLHDSNSFMLKRERMTVVSL